MYDKRRLKITVRKTKYKDMKDIFELANLPSVRESSFNSNLICWDEHVRWFKSILANPDCGFYVAEVDGRIAGQIRFIRDNEKAFVSISINPEYRGKGIGKQLYEKSIVDYLSMIRVNIIVAKIKKSNKPSIYFFTNLGFKYETSETICGHESVVMVSYPEQCKGISNEIE